MSKVYADAVTGRGGGKDLTLGVSGGNVIVTAGATLKSNTIKDAGGNNLWTSNGSGNLSSINTAFEASNLILLSTQTVTNQASVSFTSGINSTYKLYIFKWQGVNPVTDSTNFTFQVNPTDSTGYNTTVTSTSFSAYNYEVGDGTGFGYETGHDQANGTAFQNLSGSVGNGADESCSGELYLFNPSSTVYVKHFYSNLSQYGADNHSAGWWISGYFNDTTAIDDIQFKMSSGNMDAVIKMYGMG